MDQQPLEYIVVPSEMRPAHAPSVEVVGERPLQEFAAFPEQTFTSWCAYASSVCVDGVTFALAALPSTLPTPRLRRVRPPLLVGKVDKSIVRVIALVRHGLADARLPGLSVGLHTPEVLLRLLHRRADA